MKKWTLSITILGVYLLTIIYPYIATTINHTMDSKNNLLILHNGIFHLPSIIFIFTSAFLLHLSVKSQANEVSYTHKKARKELDEALNIIDFKNTGIDDFIKSKNKYCQDIKYILVNGGIEEDIELVINKYISAITSSYEKLINEYGYISTILPMLGMIGTITGLLQMFAVGGGVDNFSEKLASLSVALATTLYATLIVVFFTKPKSREIESWLIDINNDEYNLIINSKLYLHNVDLNLLLSAEDINEIDENDDKEKQKQKDN